MFAVLLAAVAFAADPVANTPGASLYRTGLYVALPGMVLDAVDRPSWQADDDVKVVGALGRVASYGGLGAMAIGAGISRGALAGDGFVKRRGLVYGVGLLGTSLALDLATMGQYAQTSTPKALSGGAAAARIGALLAFTAQGTANHNARPSHAVSLGLDVSRDHASLVASGRF